MKRVILSTALILEEGTFKVVKLSRREACDWLQEGHFENFVTHSTTKIVGVDPATERRTCDRYDEALCLKPKSRLEFGREYTTQEIEKIGVEFMLIVRIG